ASLDGLEDTVGVAVETIAFEDGLEKLRRRFDRRRGGAVTPGGEFFAAFGLLASFKVAQGLLEVGGLAGLLVGRQPTETGGASAVIEKIIEHEAEGLGVGANGLPEFGGAAGVGTLSVGLPIEVGGEFP